MGQKFDLVLNNHRMHNWLEDLIFKSRRIHIGQEALILVIKKSNFLFWRFFPFSKKS
jgi:hypothetical protein